MKSGPKNKGLWHHVVATVIKLSQFQYAVYLFIFFNSVLSFIVLSFLGVQVIVNASITNSKNPTLKLPWLQWWNFSLDCDNRIYFNTISVGQLLESSTLDIFHS